MNKSFLSILILVLLNVSCTPPVQDIFLGQGIMSGEATSSSIILQSRLTVGDTLINGDLPGKPGTGIFQIAEGSNFGNPISSTLITALPENDFIIKEKIEGLKSGTIYYYRLQFGTEDKPLYTSETGTFKTLQGSGSTEKVSMAVVTGMNYYHFHFGNYNRDKAYSGSDKALGYPALKSILSLNPDYFVGTGDNVYFDHPNKNNFDKAVKRGKNPHPGRYGGAEVLDEVGMRRKYHEQFVQPRFKDLFKEVSTYWEKDDHDYRFNDGDPHSNFPITHDQGIRNFREQVPIVDPEDANAKTYRTHRMSKDLQVWMLEGRDYRSANKMEDGPNKTMLGTEQINWLKETLLESDASFKIIISPTPMVGPDDAYKTDNHVNLQGFRHEGDVIFQWLVDNDFLDKNLYIICGDRHWQYHAMHPSGVEEFSTGALVDNNSRAGRLAGDSKSTDPDNLIKQFYVQGDSESATGGFLLFEVERKNGVPTAAFKFYDELGKLLYQENKEARQ
jgi:alkaline phosphatase D